MALALSRAAATPGTRTADAGFLQEARVALEAVVGRAQGGYGLGIAMQLAWQSPQASFSLAAGVADGRLVTAEDTFLFGSGTKAVTAAWVLHLIDAGVLRGDARVMDFVDRLPASGGKTLEDLFGAGIRNATVLDLLHMRAGIPDFEEPKPPYAFDARVLEHGGRDWPPAASLAYSSRLAGGKLLCAPGNCTCYSTASYELLGLVLASRLHVAYDSLDPGRYLGLRGLRFPGGAGALREVLTVPGLSRSPDSWPRARIWAQSPSILGGTGGNMAGTTAAVADFYHRLFTGGLLSGAGLREMLSFSNITVGWGAGELEYSAGLMENTASYAHGDEEDDPTYYYGAPGETYGFTSYQGWWPLLNASFSIVVNTDFTGADFAGAVQCMLFQAALQTLRSETADLNCATAFGDAGSTDLLATEPMPLGPSAWICREAPAAAAAACAAVLVSVFALARLLFGAAGQGDYRHLPDP